MQKQPVSINFAEGLDTKTDPKHVRAGKFLKLENSVFTKSKLWGKRNGFGLVTAISNASTISTFDGSLVGLGNSLQAYSSETGKSTNAGFIQPLSLKTQSLVRRATSQQSVDVAISSQGIACSTWLDSNGNSYYQVSDSVTGQAILPAVQLVATATNSRVFVFGPYFLITYLATIGGISHLQFVAVPILNPQSPSAATDITTDASSLSAAYDGAVSGGLFYVAWNKAATIGVTSVNLSLVVAPPLSIASNTANLMSLIVDSSSGSAVVWISWWNSGGTVIKATAYNGNLASTPILAPTAVVSSITVNELTSTSTGNVLTVFYEVANTYAFSPNAKSDYVAKNTLSLAGTPGTASTILRGVGLSSKAIYISSLAKNFMLCCYGQRLQPTYFLIDDSGNVLSKLAYSNGGGYAANQVLAQMSAVGSTLQCGYLYADSLSAVNKSQGVANVNGIYAQTGINLVSFNLGALVYTSEIGQGLHIGAGFLWLYDGVKPVEHNFHVWPEDLGSTTATTGGSLAAQIYFYQAVYEWTDSQGNIHRSSPSVPLQVDIHASGTATNTNTIYVPTLRQTYKTDNKVRIVLYRWSTAQQNYYRITSIASPTLNDPSVDSITYVDTQADSAILGNDLIYTTGGVVENIAAPGSTAMTLFQSRLFLVDAEDQNLIWFSKQAIESTPVEMSDLFTLYIAPTTGAQGSTGPITALSTIDDKLIIFKKDAIYYLNGNGPDNTGANNQFSEPVFITSTVGCNNPNSIVFMPNGLMFQSDKGIWLLGRDLSTDYIGAAVEAFNSQTVTSAVSVPGTNQVRFTLNNGYCLMYDYFYDQWGSFTNVSATSSTLFQGLHTYLNSYGQVLQETPGVYLDISRPVLMNLQTSWINVAGLRGYERLYFFFLLGTYLSPHKLQVGLSYDYNSGINQTILINPINYSGTYGSDELYGNGPGYGGVSNIEQWRLFPNRQKCQSFQISLTEVYDASLGVIAGAGFTLSGLNMVIGVKKGYAPSGAQTSAG